MRKDIFPERTYSFEKPPDPIPASDIQKTFTADVVVVGGGLAGMSAAISAAEKGAQVILIEKSKTCPCRGPNNGFIGSRLQKKLGIEIDAEEVILALMKQGANKPDQRLIRMWAEDGGKTANWLMDMTEAAGLTVKIAQYPPPLNYNNEDEYYPQYFCSHYYENPKDVAKCLMDQAAQKGVEIHFSTRAKQLIRPSQARVSGLVAQNPDNQYIQYNARRAVVLATGDYGKHAEMMAKYCPQAAYLTSMIPTSTGDGHLMAMWIGATMEPGPHAPMSHGFAGPVGGAPFLQVNLKGIRFHNEDVSGQAYTNAVERQPGRTAWQVFDAKYPDELPRMGVGHGRFNQANPMIRESVAKLALKADTLEELAVKMAVPVEVFMASVDSYNQLAQAGKDLDFGKRADRLPPIDTPPYYAGKGYFALLAVMGGLNVNTYLQALDKDWEVIPGLYVAGNTMGNRFAVDYPMMVPGISHGMALHFGRMAGLNAACA